MASPSPSIDPEGVFDGLRWAPILAGALLDNALTMIAMFPITFFAAGAEAMSEDPATAQEAMEHAMDRPEFLALSFAAGAAITTFAAFWAARRAGVLHVRHGGWTAVVSALLACALFLLPGAAAEPRPPLWFEALGLAVMIPAGVVGGWLASRLPAPGRD